jgi:Cu(I)/Ag(I) efflux system membrane protein CusA/SilA
MSQETQPGGAAQIQDWNLRYSLSSVKGVAEIAPVGGFVKQYQVDLDPNKLLGYGIPLSDVVAKIKASNADVGGKTFEVATAEYFVRGHGYIKNVADIENIPLKVDKGAPILKTSAPFISAPIFDAAWRRWTAKARPSAALS